MAGMTTQLQQLDHIPPGLLDVSARELYTILPQPTLLHLPGKQPDTLFVSVLLHGNETTGLEAIQAILRKYQQRLLPRSLSIFFGNVEAARHGVRRLESQTDYNRIWPGTDYPASAELEMAQQIVDHMRNRPLFASIDVHNNTGLNPHYACINSLEPTFQQIATLFARFVVYFNRPTGVQSAAFARLCPSVTLECGRPDQHHGAEHAADFIDSCLNLNSIPEHPVHPQDIDLFHTVARVKIKPDIAFSFYATDAELVLDKELEKMNFYEVTAGTTLGQVKSHQGLPVIASNEQGEDISDYFFEISQQQLRFRRPAMPSMLTLNEEVIRQDCLCYLMERMALP